MFSRTSSTGATRFPPRASVAARKSRNLYTCIIGDRLSRSTTSDSRRRSSRHSKKARIKMMERNRCITHHVTFNDRLKKKKKKLSKMMSYGREEQSIIHNLSRHFIKPLRGEKFMKEYFFFNFFSLKKFSLKSTLLRSRGRSRAEPSCIRKRLLGYITRFIGVSVVAVSAAEICTDGCGRRCRLGYYATLKRR